MDGRYGVSICPKLSFSSLSADAQKLAFGLLWERFVLSGHSSLVNLSQYIKKIIRGDRKEENTSCQEEQCYLGATREE